ncbi:MAG: response regulator [Myxococcota bacterium]|nr:response regulator [Myxococcota bacterium]
MITLRILHVEDEFLKASAVRKALHRAASGRGYAVEVETLTRLALLPSVEHRAFDAVITDWNLRPGCGSTVVAWAAERRLPVVVISGGERPWTWTDTTRKRWAGVDWCAGLEWLLSRATVVYEQPEVCG